MPFDIASLGAFVALSLGALAGCVVASMKGISRSRCTSINFCCMSCKREPLTEAELAELDKADEPESK